MDMIATNVGCSILASIVYDVSKFCLGEIKKGGKKINKFEIETLINDELKSKYERLFDSSEFEAFITSPYLKDIINQYFIYKTTGLCDGGIGKIKKQTKTIDEKDIVSYLTGELLENYKSVGTITVPSESSLKAFFTDFFSVGTKYIVSLMDANKKNTVFLINRRIDLSRDVISSQITDLANIIKRTMECEIVPYEKKYHENIERYHDILKASHSKAHVYLLDTFDFKEFYVPPFLWNYREENGFWERKMLIQNRTNGIIFEEEEDYEDWSHIFDHSGIVYVTGGAGYGKSLFLKKIINDFDKLNVINSKEYIVIYGDLKNFYSEGEEALSVTKFLQKSMVKETLLDAELFPQEMIDYYIKRGRCILLLDALDEVEKNKREDLHKRIIAYFQTQNPNNKICITSRNRGFIPDKEIELFDIMPLSRTQIERYVDNIIKLGRFDEKDKPAFLDQSNILVEKGFLSSFLVLSLLINIYKAERELPENKMELYQKCFDYITCRREKEKANSKFDWNLISCMMKDNTFMELAKMCYPNNSDVGKEDIVSMLCKVYGRKYLSESETERAAENFLMFCSDRTELFVPASGEDRYKFFHRSFFEYFYAQYVFLRIREVEEVYQTLLQFDVDSEIFELTLAMMKQKDELRYQELVDWLFVKIADEGIKKNKRINAFKILTLGMQVVDDSTYRQQYCEYLLNNKTQIYDAREYIVNNNIIYSVVMDNDKYVNKVLDEYNSYCEMSVIEYFLDTFYENEDFFASMDFKQMSKSENISFVHRRFYLGFRNEFYIRLYMKNVDFRDVIKKLTESKLEDLLKVCKYSKKTREKLSKSYKQFLLLDEKRRNDIQNLVLGNLYDLFTKFSN